MITELQHSMYIECLTFEIQKAYIEHIKALGYPFDKISDYKDERTYESYPYIAWSETRKEFCRMRFFKEKDTQIHITDLPPYKELVKEEEPETDLVKRIEQLETKVAELEGKVEPSKEDSVTYNADNLKEAIGFKASTPQKMRELIESVQNKGYEVDEDTLEETDTDFKRLPFLIWDNIERHFFSYDGIDQIITLDQLEDISEIKVGDRVKVIGKIIPEGWLPTWVKEMDLAIGKEYIVKEISLQGNYGLVIDEKGVYFYPKESLKKVQ